LQVIVKNAARKAGIKEWKNVVPHCIRKTFESVLRSQFADGGRLDLKTREYFMGHILSGSMDTYYHKTKIDELRREYAKLNLKPEKQVSIEVLDSLRGMAKVLGIDLARLEESRVMELGRDLNDAEKLVVAQQAIKKVVLEFKKTIESNAKTTLLTGSWDEPMNEQCPTEKTKTLSTEKGIILDGHISPQDSLSRTGSAVIYPSTEQTCDSQKTVLSFSSIQFDLDMRPQEDSLKSRPQRKTRRICLRAPSRFEKERRNGGTLLKFL
jgi:heterodisulfide reductase subunit A-like polyferredoxin